jgi:hypothetical protein
MESHIVKNASRQSGWIPLVAGAASLVFGILIYILTQADVSATNLQIDAAKQTIAQLETARQNAKKMHAHVIEAALRILPYCQTSNDAQNDLVFAALDLSKSLKPTINTGPTTAGQGSPAPTTTPSPSAAPSGNLAQRALGTTASAIAQINATPTPAPLSHELATNELTTTYTGDFAELQSALNTFARRPSAIGITLTSIARTSSAAQTASVVRAPLAALAGPPASPTPAPDNRLTITATFHHTAISTAACLRIQNDARPLASLTD